MSQNTEFNNCHFTRSQMEQVKHERDLLGNLLGEITIAAGIMDPNACPSIAQLLLVGNDLLEQLKKEKNNGEV